MSFYLQNVLEGRRHCKIETIEEAFPVGCTAFFSCSSTEFYGCRVEVESNEILKKKFG